jgi:hypothetical protein
VPARAWEDTFRRLPPRVELDSDAHYAFTTLAYALFYLPLLEKLAANPALCAGFFDFPEKVDSRFNNDSPALSSLESFVASHAASTYGHPRTSVP